MPSFKENPYHYMTYEQACKEVTKLLNNAVTTEFWFNLPEKLYYLREVVSQHAANKQ